jgi:RimJ/RimL family protein N-acetyltransferase
MGTRAQANQFLRDSWMPGSVAGPAFESWMSGKMPPDRQGRLQGAAASLFSVASMLAPDDLPFFTRLHALPEVAQHFYPGGRPRSPEETAAWLQYTLASYEQLTLGCLAVLRKEDGALIGRCGLMDLVVESAAPEHGIRRGWFGRAEAPAGVALTFE